VSSRFLTARQHNYAIQCRSRWKIQDRREIKNTGNTETKHNPEKANNAKHSKTKLYWFSRLLRHDTLPGNEVGLL